MKEIFVCWMLDSCHITLEWQWFGCIQYVVNPFLSQQIFGGHTLGSMIIAREEQIVYLNALCTCV